MWTKLHWVNGPWRGKLALAARPRGGDWLRDEMRHWRHSGVDTLLSLLEPQEEADLELSEESRAAAALGIEFLSLPIPDRMVPRSEHALAQMLNRLETDLNAGRNVVLHCRQGIGRTGLVAACLLVSKGMAPATALRTLSEARGIPVPETIEQRNWIERFALTLDSMQR